MLNVYKRWLPADIIACPFLIDSKVVSPLHLKPKWQNIGLQPPLKIILTVQRMCVLISSSKLLALDVKLNCVWQFLLLIAHLGRQWMAKQNHIITFFNLLHAKKNLANYVKPWSYYICHHYCYFLRLVSKWAFYKVLLKRCRIDKIS